jgi:hypothetical protein
MWVGLVMTVTAIVTVAVAHRRYCLLPALNYCSWFDLVTTVEPSRNSFATKITKNTTK